MSLDLSSKQLDTIWADQGPLRADRGHRQNYYDGEHAILAREELYAGGDPKTNRVANWARYIVNRYVGLIAATPYSITNKDSESDGSGPETYSEIADANDFPALDVEHLRSALAQGTSVELHEFFEDEVIVTQHDPRNWALILGDDGVVVGAIYRIVLTKGTIVDGKPLAKDTERMWFYNDVTRQAFTKEDGEKEWVKGEGKEHLYGRVPVFAWRVNVGGASIITDALIGLCDEFNEIFSSAGDDIRRSVDSLLKIWGFDAESLKDNLAVIRETKILPLGDKSDSDAEFLKTTMDVEPAALHLARTREIIHMTGEVPDSEQITGATGTTSGIALKLKFLPMLQAASSMANNLKAGVRERIDLINSRLAKKDFGEIEDIKIIIQLTLPTNRIEEWKNIGALKGVVSHKTQLELLSDIDDPEAELERIEAEGPDLDDEILAPEAAAERQDEQVAALALELGPAVQVALEAMSAAVTDEILRSGVIDRTLAKAGG